MLEWAGGRPVRCLKFGIEAVAWAETERSWRGGATHRCVLSSVPEGSVKPSPVEPNLSDLPSLTSRIRALAGPGPDLRIGRRVLAKDLPRPIVLIILWDVGQALMGHQEASRIGRELERVRQEDGALLGEASRDGLDLSDGVLQLLPTEVAFANQLLAKRMFSWTKFLTGLEQAIPPRVALTSVRLDAGGTVVHMTGAAVSLEDITAFTVGLKENPSFKDPVLAQHRSGSSGLVEFDVTVRYRREGV